MNQPLVSIVLSCHNRAHLLPQTMESIFAQSYRPVEIVVVDDGSIDETPELMKAYGDKIRYIRQQNLGIASSRNVGLKMAKGVFIAFQDDDDLMPPDRIDCLMQAFAEYPSAVLAVGNYAFIDVSGKATGEISRFEIQGDGNDPIEHALLIEDGYAAVLWPKLTPLPHTTLFRKADAERVDGFDTRFFHACSDTDFFARLGRLGPVVYLPKIVSYYRFGHSSIWNEKLFAAYSRFLLFEKHIKSIENRQSLLMKRLRYRLRETLKHVAILSQEGNFKDKLPNNLWDRGMALLSEKDRLNFKIYATLVVPIREKFLGSNFEKSFTNYLLSQLERKSNENNK